MTVYKVDSDGELKQIPSLPEVVQESRSEAEDYYAGNITDDDEVKLPEGFSDAVTTFLERAFHAGVVYGSEMLEDLHDKDEIARAFNMYLLYEAVKSIGMMGEVLDLLGGEDDEFE